MWQRWLGVVCALALCVQAALAVSAYGNRVLLVLDDEKENYSGFIESLDRSGYQVTLAQSSEAKRDDALFSFGERQYDHLALLVPELKGLKDALAPQQLVRFAEDGGNLLVGLSPRVSEAWRDFAREFRLEVSERDTKLVDHFGYDAERDHGDHRAVLVGGRRAHFAAGGAANERVFSQATREALEREPLIYRGIAHWIGPNPLAFSILAPPATSYQSDVPKIVGGEAKGIKKLEAHHDAAELLTGFDAASPDATASLVSAVQLRPNSARVTFVGSVELLGNALYGDDARPLQRAVVDDIVRWTFQERGVLRVVRTAHERVRKSEEDVRPDYEEEVGVAAKMYRVKDEVFFALELQQFEREWQPAPTDLDLQLAVTMLDPYITLPLEGHVDGEHTRYQGSFRLPDRHGVFTLRVNWKRHGWTYVLTEDVVPVRPFNHDEYPRYLSSSWPYIAGALSTMLGFAVFVALWLLLPVDKAPGKTE